MPVQPGEVKITPPIQETIGGDGTRSFKVYRVWFSIRGEGNYSVDIPQEDYTPAKAQAAILKRAGELVDTLDLFK